MRKIHIFDTTLRDGEQSPGVHLTTDDKVTIARQLEALGVDRIEAGFPIASPGEIRNIQAIAKEVRNTSIAGLARAHRKDIDACRTALAEAAHPCIHVFLATSPIHRKYKLNMTKDKVVETAVEAVKYASQFFNEIEFSLEDASRTEPEFMYRVIEAVTKAGAKIINLPDTVGFASPETFGDLFRGVRENVPAADHVMLSTHCHNDLGMATANTLAAIKGGADQVEGTINGIGERAGNTALEEVALALEMRPDVYEASTNMVLSEIYKTSQLVRKLTGMVVQSNKAIVGDHAFAHESGIHQDGMLKESTTYEIIKPETIGAHSSTLVLGKHSGRHALGEKLNYLGYELSLKELAQAFEKFKQVIDEQQYITDDELHHLVNENFVHADQHYVFTDVNIHYAADEAKVELEVANEKEESLIVQGIDNDVTKALFKAVASLAGTARTLENYEMQTKQHQGETKYEVIVKMADDTRSFTGRGNDLNIFKAGAIAFISALNQSFYEPDADNKSDFTYVN